MMSDQNKAAAEAGKQAEELHKQVYGDTAESAKEENLELDLGTPPPDLKVVENTPAPAPEAQQPPAPEPQVVDSDALQILKDELAQMQQSYKVMKGKYDAEVPRMHQSLQTMREENEALRAQPQAQPPADNEHLLSEEEVDAYGEDLIGVIRKAAREEFSGEVNKLHTENQSLREQINNMGQTVAVSQGNTLRDQLTQLVPEWKELDGDSGFLAWLGESDPFSGYIRHNMLKQAYTQNDVQRVAMFFKAYLSEHAAVNEAVADAQQAHVAQNQGTTMQLDTLVAPGSPKESLSAPDEVKRVYTEADVNGFYSNVQRGVYKNDPAKKARIEADIIAAGREGRIR